MTPRCCTGQAYHHSSAGWRPEPARIALINKSIDLNPNNATALQTAGSLYAYAGDKQISHCSTRAFRPA